MLLLLILLDSSPKEETIKISKTYDVTSAEHLQVIVQNVYGSVRVQPSTSGKVELELEIKIRANSDKLMALAKKELELGEYIEQDTLAFYTKAPWVQNCNGSPYKGFNWNNGPDYQFSYEYVLKIPKTSMISANTVNDGEVIVENIQGEVKVGNVNGGVEVKNVYRLAGASTVNGDVKINFLRAPKEAINFRTVNGDFQLEFPKDFAATVYFDSMNGEMYSSFDYEDAKPKVETSNGGKGAKYKISSKTGVIIGSGGPELNFSSINGNVYLRKQNTGS
ncbi:MAG: DUF4097 family beta strand repeat-containing protein [Cyclobacteriaceae bacterium]